MRLIAIALFCLTTGIVAAQSPPDEGTSNAALLDEYNALGMRGEYAKQAAMWSTDAVNNGRPMRPAMIGTILTDIYRTFPDYQSTPVEKRVIGDTIIVLARISGTHRGIAQTNFNGGLLLGAKPTGKRFEVLSTHWWRFRDGKIVWHQATRDDLGMMRQLGLIPDTLPADKLISSAKD